MEKKDALFEYIEKIKDLSEFLARGYGIITPQCTVINFDRDIALKEGSISISEEALYDGLECSYYNELGSIQRMIELINECDQEKLQEEISPFISEPVDSDNMPKRFNKEYKAIKKGLKEVLNKIVLQLYVGLRIEPTDVELAIIENLDFQNRKTEDDQMDYMEYLKEIEDEEESETEKTIDTMRHIENPYLTYSMTQKKFYLVQDGEILVDDVDTNLAMEISVGYLYRKEKEKGIKELISRKPQSEGLKYDGIHISINDERGEL